MSTLPNLEHTMREMRSTNVAMARGGDDHSVNFETEDVLHPPHVFTSTIRFHILSNLPTSGV